MKAGNQTFTALCLIFLRNWVDADQTTGRVIHIPNGKIYTQPLANYHAGFSYIWNEIPVLVTFESNWQKAKSILLEIINTQADQLSAAMQKENKVINQDLQVINR